MNSGTVILHTHTSVAHGMYICVPIQRNAYHQTYYNANICSFEDPAYELFNTHPSHKTIPRKANNFRFQDRVEICHENRVQQEQRSAPQASPCGEKVLKWLDWDFNEKCPPLLHPPPTPPYFAIFSCSSVGALCTVERMLTIQLSQLIASAFSIRPSRASSSQAAEDITMCLSCECGMVCSSGGLKILQATISLLGHQ